jgi:hypothetical protein
MEHATLSWSFGDPTGWTIACVLFLLWSGLVGLGISSISYRLLSMGSLDQKQRASRRASGMLGSVIACAIFLALYFASLSGFTQLDLRNDQLTLRYILPERTMALPFSCQRARRTGVHENSSGASRACSSPDRYAEEENAEDVDVGICRRRHSISASAA